MSDVVIRVENISKRYRIGLKEKKYDTLGGKIISTIKTPIKNFRKLRSLSKFAENELSEDIIWALKDINFEVKQGEVLGIIGKNGAGKSTLLKILAQITPPSSGRVELRGRVASLLEVGTGFNGELTGRENVYLNGTILGMTKKEIDRKFDEIIAFSGVERFIDTPVKRYSSGMTVRLAFAVAAFLEPEILLIDEVLAVGDVEFQKKCLGKMGEVAKGGRTVLFVSHNMQAVQKLCHNAILLEGGTIKYFDTTDKVIAQYLRKENNNDSKKSWESLSDAPGNDMIRVKSVVVKPLGKSDEFITVETSFLIEILFWNLRFIGLFNISLHLYSSDGTLIFATVSPQHDITKNLMKFICHIPGDLLNDGNYYISIMFVGNHNPLFFFEEAWHFEINDKRNIDWFGKWHGLIRPTFEWEISSII